MSSSENPFRSAAEMVAAGAVSRPAYLDDSPLAPVADVTAAPRPVAAKTAAVPVKVGYSADRVGRLMH